ncbi:MAG: hypothetical protein R2851_13550 [Caldilineaceae bacterium]
MERAEKAGIPTRVHTLKPYRDAGRIAGNTTPTWPLVKEYKPDWVCSPGGCTF